MDENTKSPDSETFHQEIDGTIDDLFNPTRRIEIDPLTNEIRELSDDVEEDLKDFLAEEVTDHEDVPLELEQNKEEDVEQHPEIDTEEIDVSGSEELEETFSFEISDEDKEGKEEEKEEEDYLDKYSPDPLQKEFSELDHLLLSLDWEVTKTNVLSLSEHFKNLKKIAQIEETSKLNEIFSLISKILEGMAEYPEKMPITAPNAIQKSVESLKMLLVSIEGEFHSEKEKEKIIADTVGKLKEALPEEPVSMEELFVSDELPKPSPEEKLEEVVPEEDRFFKDEQETAITKEEEKEEEEEEEEKVIETAGKKIQEEPPAPEKEIPLAETEAAREVLELNIAKEKPKEEKEPPVFTEEIVQPEETTPPHLSPEREPGGKEEELSLEAFALSDSITSLEEEVTKIKKGLKVHIDELDNCIESIIPIEKLFGRTPKLEKLYSFQKNLRLKLEKQRNILKQLLEEGIEIEGSMAEADHSPGQETSKEKGLPWPKLMAGYWGGQFVAFLPEEICFNNYPPFNIKTSIHKIDVLALKKLKLWPWSKISQKMKPPLGELSENKLKTLAFPIVRPDASLLSSDYQPPKNAFLILLYKNGEGRFLVLDVPLEEIKGGEEWWWKPLAKGRKPWAGRIEKEEESIPVVTVSSLIAYEKQ